MAEIKIQKVKIIKGETLEVEYRATYPDKRHSDLSAAPDWIIHSDLKAAAQNLRLHLAVISEYVPVKKCREEGALDTFVVTGYSIGGKEDEEGIIISGYKLLKSGQAQNFNTVFTRFDQEEKSAYYFMPMLKADIAAIETEVLAYLDGSKKAPDPQLSMFPEENKNGEHDGDDDEDHEEAAAEAPKKRGRKKKQESAN